MKSSVPSSTSSWILPFLLGGVACIATVAIRDYYTSCRQGSHDDRKETCPNFKATTLDNNDHHNDSVDHRGLGQIERQKLKLTDGNLDFTSKDESSPWIRLVVQRARSASLKVYGKDGNDDNVLKETKEHSSLGIIVYISFSKRVCIDTTLQSDHKKDIMAAARTILNLPVLTSGEWGDGSKPMSVLKMASNMKWKEKPCTDLSTSTYIVEYEDAHENVTSRGVFVMIVPQANLICKSKSHGKSLQYHQQIEKKTGETVYYHLIKAISLLALEHQLKCQNKPIPSHVKEELNFLGGGNSKLEEIPASCPPHKMFQDYDLYSSWDDSGFPLADIQGNLLSDILSNSRIKRLRKKFDQQKKRHENFLKSKNIRASPTNIVTDNSAVLDHTFLNLINGTYGRLQSLEIMSDMGPFCHVIDL